MLRHQGAVYFAAFDADGRRVVTVSRDGTARVWDGLTGQPLAPPLSLPPLDVVDAAAFIPGGCLAVSHSADAAQVWDAVTGKPVTSALPHKLVVHAAFSLDSRHVATAGGDKTARVWDRATGQLVGQPLQHLGAVDHVAFSPDARLNVRIP